MSNPRQKVINISPYHYIHVKDNNTSTISVVTGPKSYIVQEHEELIFSTPAAMLIIPPMNYAKIKNPVIRDPKTNQPVKDKNGQEKLRESEIEYRFHEDYKNPFVLYYGEELVEKIKKLTYVKTNSALLLRCINNFTDKHGVERQVGDEWMFIGPKVYYPTQEVEIVRTIQATIINPCNGLRLKARQNFTDRNGNKRKAGEEWIEKTTGAYIPDVYEDVVKLQTPITIKEKQCIHLRAIKSFVDCYGKEHKAGDEWLITPKISTWHVVDIYEELIEIKDMIILTKDKYVVILNPMDEESGKNQRGARKLLIGPKFFFLQPGEELEKGIQNVKLLNENQAVLIQCNEKFTDETGTLRIPGDRWMIRGPTKFVPPIEVDILENRSVIPLDEKEGIYVRNCNTGTVRSIIGKAYMLDSNEELWEKELSDIEEQILARSNPGQGKRDKTRVVSYKCPYNTIMQIYNFRSDKSRIVFGPDLVMLEPDEQFSLMSLSGKTPKVPGIIKTLYLNMGPTYTTDKIEVETSDHALMVIEVAYNWFFDARKDEADKHLKIFSVRDCIGEMCSIMASRVRGAVAEMTLNEFHKNSARTVRRAVMGITSDGKISDKYLFENNLLAISNVDIKSISTKDQATKEKLQVTVNKAIEMTTKSQEEEAKSQAETREQEAKSLLQRKINQDNQQAEDLKRPLYELKSKTESIRETGAREAIANSKANSMIIESESKIKVAKNNKELQNLKSEFEMFIQSYRHEINLEYEKMKNEIEISKKNELTNIETDKFEKIIDAIGKDTLVKISQAGPEAQVKLLEGLGLEGFIMTNGNTPVNLFDFANNVAKN